MPSPLTFSRASILLATLLILAAFLGGCGPSVASSGRTSSVAPTEPALALPARASYVSLGASETYGVGAHPRTRGYAYVLARMLHAREFADVGIPGTTLDAGYDSELTSALAARPSLCTLFFGFNDLQAQVPRASFLADLRDMTSALRQSGARVLIIGLPDLSRMPAVARLRIGNIRTTIASWNAGMRRVARETGASFLDLAGYGAELASHPRYVAADGLHPSNQGHARLAQVIRSAIASDRLWKTP